MDLSSDSTHYFKDKKGPDEPKIKRNCIYCGSNRPRGKCPAFGKTCPRPNKLGHFPQVCKAAPGMKPNETGKAQSKQVQKQKVHKVTDYKRDDSFHNCAVHQYTIPSRSVQETRYRVQYFTLPSRMYMLHHKTRLY